MPFSARDPGQAVFFVVSAEGALRVADDALVTLAGLDRAALAAGKVPWAALVVPEGGGHALVCADGARVPVQLVAHRAADGSSIGSLVRANDEDETLTRREAFLGAAAHDLRNRVTLLTLNAGLLAALAANAGRADVRDAAGNLSSHLARLEGLLRSLLDGVESGEVRLTRGPTDLGQLARDVAARHRAAARRMLCPLRVEVRAAASGSWDAEALDRAIDNLLDNALKYGPGAAVLVRVAAREGGGACLSVTDGGPGIAPADHERVFTRFERLASGRHVHGFGLGLWVVRRLVEAHGGAVRVESELGRGATFTIELPA